MNASIVDTQDWPDAVQHFCEEFSERLATASDYERRLRDLIQHPRCPVDKLAIRTSGADRPIVLLDAEITEAGPESTEKWTPELAKTTWVIEAWRSPASSWQETLDETQARSLLDCFWKSHLRDAKSGLISFQYPDTAVVLNRYLKHTLVAKNSVACFYVDLDNFKKVNDKHGHEEGDRIILQWSTMIERRINRDCIVLHRSGDEFLIFCPTASATCALNVATTVMRETTNTNFRVPDVNIGCSIGIAIQHPGSPIDCSELAMRAEDAIVSIDGGKRRGRVCFEKSTQGFSTPRKEPNSDLSFELLRAICVMGADPTSANTFASPWLNNIANVAYDAARIDASLSTVQGQVDDVLCWIDELRQGNVFAACVGLEDDLRIPSFVLTYMDVAVAVARGVFGAAARGVLGEVAPALSLRYTSCRKGVEVRAEPGSTSVWRAEGHHGVDGQWQSCDLGSCADLGAGANTIGGTGNRACLVKIGHDALALLSPSLFAEVITVDDRPARGGQLPDFWEAAVARLIALLAKRPSVQFVYILGDRRFANRTVDRLLNARNWNSDLEQMVYRTGSTAGDVAAASERLESVQVFRTERELVPILARDLRLAVRRAAPTKPVAPALPPRFLERTLEHADFSLSRRDGIRVDTIALAFPVVLETARKAVAEDVIKDAAGQALRELIDFKVVLGNPTVDRVPAFYQAERHSLDQYLRRAFLDDDALFGKELRAGGQIDAVLRHLSIVISQGTKFATRRAILVVPHTVVNGAELAPLGLVSIRLIPRFHGQQVSVLYSFTWRTVEAFVGFPYSLYGSVGFAEYLTKKLQHRVSPEGQIHIRMGEVSYIAHSLHMFVDDYGQNIARRIVDDASR